MATQARREANIALNEATKAAGGFIAAPSVTSQPTAQTAVTSPVAPIASQPTFDISGTPLAKISTNSLASSPYTIPAPSNDSTARTNLSANVAGVTSTQMAEPAKATPETPESILSQLSKIGAEQATQGDFTAQAQKDVKLEEKRLAINNFDRQSAEKKKTYEDKIKKVRENIGGMSQDQLDNAVTQLEQKANEDLANIAIQKSVALGDLNTALQIVKDKVEAKFEPLKNQIETFKTQYALLQNDMSESQKVKAQSIEAQLTRDYEKKKLADKTLEETRLEALMNAQERNAPSSVISAIQNAKTPEDVISSAGSYGTDLKRKMEISKLQSEISNNKPITGEWASVINGASGLVASTKKGTVQKNISNALANEDYATAFAEVSNAVSDGLTGTVRTRFDDSNTDIGVMSGMRDAIKAYTDAGGDIGFLKGTADSIAKKFGRLQSDPEFAALGVLLTREFQAYRNAMTGAAFTPQESKEYAAVNPRTNASLDLNLATIDGAIAQLTNRVNQSILRRVPSASKLIEKLNENTTQNIKLELDSLDLTKDLSTIPTINFFNQAP